MLSLFLTLLRIRESEFRVGNGEDRRPQTEPKKAVEQQDSGKRNQPGVAFKGSPVLRDALDRIGSEGISQGCRDTYREIGGKLRCYEISDQQDSAGGIDRKHLPSQSSQSKKDGGDEDQIGDDQDEVGLEIGRDVLRSDARWVDGGEMCRDPRAQADAGEDDQLDGQGAQVSSSQIVKLGDGSGVEERGAVVVHVLIGSLSSDGGGDDNAEERYEADNVVQGKRRVHQNFAASPKIDAGLAELHRRQRRRTGNPSRQTPEKYT